MHEEAGIEIAVPPSATMTRCSRRGRGWARLISRRPGPLRLREAKGAHVLSSDPTTKRRHAEPGSPDPVRRWGGGGVGASGGPGGGGGTEDSRGRPLSHACVVADPRKGRAVAYRSAGTVPTRRPQSSRSVACRCHVKSDEA